MYYDIVVLWRWYVMIGAYEASDPNDEEREAGAASYDELVAAAVSAWSCKG